MTDLQYRKDFAMFMTEKSLKEASERYILLEDKNLPENVHLDVV